MNSIEIFREISKLLSSNDGHYKKLLKYADKLLRRSKISGRAVTAEDVIFELFSKIADGKRKWDREKEPDLYLFMLMTIKSWIRNYWREELKFIKPSGPENQDEYDQLYNNYIDDHCILSPRSLEDRVDDENAAACCFMIAGDDKKFRQILELLSCGMQRKEIAIKLGMTGDEVAAAMRRIRRKLKYLIKDYKTDGGK